MKVTAAIKSLGYGLSGNIGVDNRKTYYTPDGRVIKAFPDMRQYVRKDRDGQVIGQGTRDANLDRGWLENKPAILKLFCRSCDKWHDTQAEVKACELKNNRMFSQIERKAKREEKLHTTDLERQVATLTALVEKLMEGKNGHGEVKPTGGMKHRKVFQSKANGRSQAPRKQRTRKAEVAVQ